ncbi:hypothetical protein SEVIR_5G045101v4 [Setaria viridis]
MLTTNSHGWIPFLTIANRSKADTCQCRYKHTGENCKGGIEKKKEERALQRVGFTSVEDEVERRPARHLWSLPVRPATMAVEGKAGGGSACRRSHITVLAWPFAALAGGFVTPCLDDPRRIRAVRASRRRRAQRPCNGSAVAVARLSGGDAAEC